MERDVSRRGICIIYILLVLFTIAPILSVAIASTVANLCGCKLDEGGPHPCVILGVDVGALLASMGVAGWLMLVTIPMGALGILGFTLEIRKSRKRDAG